MRNIRIPAITAFALVTVLLISCNSGPPPVEVTRTVVAASIAGDDQLIIDHLAREDSAVVARYFRTDTLERLTTEGGEPGVTLDSVKEIHRGADSAVVRAFLTVPNWERVGGRLKYEDYRTVDRGQDASLVASLPRISDRWTMVTVLQNGRWRLRLRLAESVAFTRHFLPAHDEKLPINTRRLHFDSLIAIADTPEQVAEFRSIRDGLAAAMTIRIEMGPNAYMGGRWYTIVNPSDRDISSLDLVIVDATGKEVKEYAFDIPAGGQKRELTLRSVATPIREIRIVSAKAKPSPGQ